MSNEPLLSSEEVASVLATDQPDGATGAGEPSEHTSTAYSLRRPVAIAPEDEPEARKRLERLAANLELALRGELQAEIILELQGFQQEQADAALATLPQPAWVLSLIKSGGGGLALALGATCGLGMVELALGGAGKTAAKGREPTPLETRVLSKLCSTLAPTVARKTGVSFGHGVFSQRRSPGELASPGQTLGIGLMKLRIAEADRSGLLLATPDLLRVPAPRKPGTQELRPGPMARRVERVPMEVRAVLGAGRVRLSDLIALGPGDVLSLDACESSTFILRINGRDMLKGNLARQDRGLAFNVKWRRGRRMTVRE
jgi:flagellar motor switch protein FliM